MGADQKIRSPLIRQARFFKSRPLACEMIAEGHLRLNGQRCQKPGHQVGMGDTLTFPQELKVDYVRVWQ